MKTDRMKLMKKVVEDVEYIEKVLSESELGDFFFNEGGGNRSRRNIETEKERGTSDNERSIW